MDKDFNVGMQFELLAMSGLENLWYKNYLEDLNSYIVEKEFKYLQRMETLHILPLDNEALHEIFYSLGMLYFRDTPIVLNREGIIRFRILRNSSYFTVITTLYTRDFESWKMLDIRVKDIFLPYLFSDISLSINFKWYFHDGRDLKAIFYNEIIQEDFYPQAYPYIPDLEAYIDSYLESPESILLLMGKPGTGKTRLIRHILNKMARRKQKALNVGYSSDKVSLRSTRIYQDLLEGTTDTIVLEDIDFDLQERKEGNIFMYTLLNASDGIISSFGKKIILSTNLPSQKDIDEALLRRGRCFDVLHTRDLDLSEIDNLASAAGLDIRAEKPLALADIFNTPSIRKQANEAEPVIYPFGFIRS